MEVDFSHVGQHLAQNVNLGASNAQGSALPDADKQPPQAEPTNEAVKAERTTADTIQSAVDAADSIETAVAEISEFVQTQNRALSFSVDENSQRSVVKVTDTDSGDVIRQIPSEEVLKLAERIQDLQSDVGAAVGVLFNREV